MSTLNDARADLKSVSEKISELSKTIALSVIGLCWVLLLGGKDAPALPNQVDTYLIAFSIIASLLSLVAGYFQYLFAYASSKAAHDAAESAGSDSVTFDSKSILYRMRTWLFYLKQFLAGISVVLLIVAIVKTFN
ncbi:hypothetical protein [Stenotrophomonas pavanii]|uniref:hypothetical protein n=1 Tax=Stenotrophomonas pavanii TaxID=487698 RepID=UPI0031D395D6